MRISAALIAAISTPVLLITACTTKDSKPITGTVFEKEHEEAVYGTRKVPVTKKTCTAKIKHKTPQTCTTVNTGKTKKGPRYLKKAECYELSIQVSADEVVEICDKAAYKALDVKDRYSSEVDYNQVNQ